MKFGEIEKLKIVSKKIALIEAIIQQEWEYRYYSYNSKWSNSEEMASMRDGCGNHYFILFSEEKCFIKVIDKEINNYSNIMEAISGLDNESKKELLIFLNEPAFYVDEISFLYWNINGNWNSIEKGKSIWLNILLDPVSEYKKFARDYYEIELNQELVSKIINENFSFDLAIKINPAVDIDLLKKEIDEIGLI